MQPSRNHPRVLAPIVLALATLVAESASAVVKTAPLDNDINFPRPPVVKKQARFWTKIFHRYPTTSVIVHESSDTDRIIDVIDYKLFASRERRDDPVPRKERDEVTSKYLKRYNKALERFAAEGERATRYGAIEKRLYKVYSRDEASLARLYAGDVKIRAQTGLADDFLRAASVAQLYLPYMESVFKQYGVPVRLTRLAFVESMFNLKARSKVGASGLWQFMPETARGYIYVTSLVDERNNPFKATKAAAQFLLGNYRELQAWPLAITAYNHGRLGMQRAVQQVGTRDIGEIIKRYESNSYGFASKNFYAEFLAAADTYDRLVNAGRIQQRDPLPALESIILPQPLSIEQIVKNTPLSKELLAEHNPCLLESTIQRNSAKPLPNFYELKVPRNLARATKAALDGLAKRKYARR